MSTLAEMSPCSFEQGKAEVKGITRRPRFVMKPNIRPGPGKSAGTAPKHKMQSSASMPAADVSPSFVKSSHTVADETTDHPESEGLKSASIAEERSKVPNPGVADSTEFSTVPPSQKVQTVTPNDESVDKCSNVCTDIKKGKDQPSAAKVTESAHPAKPSDPILPRDKGEKALEKPDKVPRVDRATSACEPLPEQGNTKDGSEVDSRETASEFDASVSECLSQDADKERGAEVDEEVKKHKRRRSKKQRAEPLPSREKSPDRQKMKMSDLLSWNPQQNFLPKKVKKKITTPSSPEQAGKVDEDKEESNQSASLPAPQVMIGPDGSVVLNTESLLIQSVLDETKLPEAIEEDDDDRYLNTNSYRKHKKTKFWTEDETERFFLGLSMCGTDFSLMTNLLTNRSRRELKNKFHREEKCRRPLIDKALAHRRAYDQAPFLEMVAEEEEKAKKLAKKKLKVKAEEKEEKKAAKRKTAKKRKKSCSENEEDDWQQILEEDDDDLVEKKEHKPQLTVTKRKKSKADKGQPRSTEAAARKKQGLEAEKDQPHQVPESTEPGKGIHPEINADTSPAKSTLAPHTIQSIPGSSQVQIEMEGVNNPVQGVLIPKSMIPLIAPQLGIPANNTDYQVLLVQEQSSSGNLVHVYIIPDSEGKDNSTPGKTVVPGAACASTHLSTGAQATGLPFSLPSTWAKASSHEAEGRPQGLEADATAPSARQHCQPLQRTQQPSCSTTSSIHTSALHTALQECPSLTDGSEPHAWRATAHDSSVPCAQDQPQVSVESGVTCKDATMELQAGGTDLASQKPKCLIVDEGQCEEDRYTLTSL